jgi:hypothetical protein
MMLLDRLSLDFGWEDMLEGLKERRYITGPGKKTSPVIVVWKPIDDVRKKTLGSRMSDELDSRKKESTVTTYMPENRPIAAEPRVQIHGLRGTVECVS